MEYSDDYLRRHLPRESPPLGLVPGDVERELASYIEIGDFEDRELLTRSVRWTYAIFSEMALSNYRWSFRRGPWLDFIDYPFSKIKQDAIVGLYDPKSEMEGFGISINFPGWDGSSFYQIGTIYFPRLNTKFPISIRPVETELHAMPNPNNATTACWARCNTNGNWGIITAGHAIGTSFAGLAVPLDDGTSGISHRSFWQPIDAAFVLTTAPNHLPAPLSIHHFPAAGIPMGVECKAGTQFRTVVSACNSLGFYQTRLFPVLFFLDNPCVAGDSGALVRLPTGEAGGIYVGSQPSPSTGGNSGRVLNFAQAMFALDTTPYR